MKTIKNAVQGGYYGRGIAVGVKNGRVGVLYFVTGRSENSKNRVLVERADGVYTEPFDPSKCVDPSLIIYRATCRVGGKIVVTNGDQTETIKDAVLGVGTFFDALQTRTYEPDGPIYTPRISACIDEKTGVCEMAILRRNVDGSCDRSLYCYEPQDGVGHLFSTYAGGMDCASFSGEPIEFSMPESALEMAKSAWEGLDERLRVGVYSCYYDLKTGNCEKIIINEKAKV